MCSGSPLARAVRMWLEFQHLHHGAACEARDVGDLRQGEADDGEEAVAQLSFAPARGRQPVQIDAEHQREERGHDEVGDHNPDHRRRHDGEV